MDGREGVSSRCRRMRESVQQRCVSQAPRKRLLSSKQSNERPAHRSALSVLGPTAQPTPRMKGWKGGRVVGWLGGEETEREF